MNRFRTLDMTKRNRRMRLLVDGSLPTPNQTGRSIINLAHAESWNGPVNDRRQGEQFTDWDSFSNGDGTKAISGANDEFITLGATTTGRANYNTPITFLSGKTYAVSFDVTAISGTSNESASGPSGGGTLTGDTVITSAEIEAIGVGRYVHIFSCSGDSTEAWRLGVGLYANHTAGAYSITYANFMIQDITAHTATFDPWNKRHIPSNLAHGTLSRTGIQPVTASPAPGDAGRGLYFRNAYAVGDSFANDANDWADALNTLMVPGSGRACFSDFNGVGILLGPIVDEVVTALASSNAEQYDGVILQGGINTITNAGTSAAMIADLDRAKIACNTARIPLIVVGVSPFNAHAGWSAPEQAVLEEYNTAAAAWCAVNGYSFIDIYTLLGDSADADKLSDGADVSPDYDSGDGLHPNAAGMTVIANAINDEIESTWAVTK